MKSLKYRVLAVLLTASCMGAVAASDEGDMPPPGPMMGGHGPMERGQGLMERGQGPMKRGRGPMGHGPMFAPGVELSDAQEDKVFAILHAQEPKRREQRRTLHKSQDALRAMGTSEQFDDAKAAALAKEAGNAMAALALLDARTDAQLRAVLTPEQRKQSADSRARRQPRS